MKLHKYYTTSIDYYLNVLKAHFVIFIIAKFFFLPITIEKKEGICFIGQFILAVSTHPLLLTEWILIVDEVNFSYYCYF